MSEYIDRPLTEVEAAYIEGLAAYAWMKDGTLYVGTTGTTLRRAVERYIAEQDAAEALAP